MSECLECGREKEQIPWESIVKKAKKIGGIEKIEVNINFGSVKVRFFKEEVEIVRRKTYTKRDIRKNEEVLEKIRQEAEINEMSLLEPAAYEEQLALGNIVED